MNRANPHETKESDQKGAIPLEDPKCREIGAYGCSRLDKAEGDAREQHSSSYRTSQ